MGETTVGGGPSAGEDRTVPGAAAPEAGVPEPQAAEAGELEAAGGAADLGSEGEVPRAKRRTSRPFWQELPLLVGIALVLALVIKIFFVQAFLIPSESMQNTLQPGDRILVDKLTPWFGAEPERGEVVVFHDPGDWLRGEKVKKPNAVQQALSFVGLMPSGDEKDLVKRVIAIGGDTVECKAGGPVLVNGKALDDSYIYPGNTPCDDMPFGPVKVPKGRLWMMGDHRQDSGDSRYNQDLDGGTVGVDQVVGRAFVVAWPVGHWATLPVPATYQQKFTAAAAGGAPPVLAVAGALPIVWRRRRRQDAGPGQDAGPVADGA